MSKLRMSIQLAAGFFRTDPAAGFFSRMLEVFSRALWQQPQTLAGFLYNLGAIWAGKVSSVQFYHGCTAVKGSGLYGRSACLGLYLCLTTEQSDCETSTGTGQGSYTTMHECGHYLQSRLLGPFYLFVIGIPSASGAWFCEVDANRRAAAYFQKRVPGFRWDPFYYPKGSRRNLYSRFTRQPDI